MQNNYYYTTIIIIIIIKINYMIYIAIILFYNYKTQTNSILKIFL